MRVVDWAPERITAEIEKKAMDRLEKAAEYVAARARQYFPLGAPPPVGDRKSKNPWVPMSKGDLQKSIRTSRLKGDPKLDIRVIAGSREKGGAFYAHMVEYGTVKMKAKPFLRPAFNSAKAKIKAMLGAE